MANQGVGDKKPGGGDVTKADKVPTETQGETTDWTPFGQKGSRGTDGYDD